MSESNIWYVDFPTYRYNEDVSALARQNGLTVIDAAATVSRDGATDKPPALTLKAEYKPKQASKAAAMPMIDAETGEAVKAKP
jgi:hypothetical protein